jgi:hypothetical protein
MSFFEQPYIWIPFLSCITLIFTMAIKACYSSKCTRVKCGSLEIIRDTINEPSVRHITGVSLGNNNNSNDRDIRVSISHPPEKDDDVIRVAHQVPVSV